jgi:hypothetical protein
MKISCWKAASQLIGQANGRIAARVVRGAFSVPDNPIVLESLPILLSGHRIDDIFDARFENLNPMPPRQYGHSHLTSKNSLAHEVKQGIREFENSFAAGKNYTRYAQMEIGR